LTLADRPSVSAHSSSFAEACASLSLALAGETRRLIVDEVSKAKTFDRAVRHLRDSMRSHLFESGGAVLFSGRFARTFDQVTRRDGFHALHDWDGKADRFNDEMIPVEIANFAERMIRPADHQRARAALAILLDDYFAHLLGLLALRAWDQGDPNANLDLITRLLSHLQGPWGSGQVFAGDVTGLIIVTTSHFEPDVTAYDRLLSRVRLLNPDHRLKLALVHAAVLGCHLRFGLEVTCAGDLRALRDDNVPDYPWLCEGTATLLDAYEAAVAAADGAARRRISEALLLALLPDPAALLGSAPPESLARSASPRERIREIFTARRHDLMVDFEAHRPDPGAYSPLSFTFNFPHNLVKGIVVDAALRGAPWSLSLADLVTAIPRTPELDRARRSLATTLMGYALASPDTIRGRPHPAIVCDPAAGLRAFEQGVRNFAAC
jgi:hypothetical protein